MPVSGSPLTDELQSSLLLRSGRREIEIMEKYNIMTLEEIIALATTFRDLKVDSIHLQAFVKKSSLPGRGTCKSGVTSKDHHQRDHSG